jgi:transmembrane sensor
VDAPGRVTVERGAVSDEDLAWADGRLVFRDAPMARVASDLGRRYGLVVVPDGPLAARRLTATFETASADEALRVVGAVLGAEVRRRGDTAFVAMPTPR